MTNANYVYAYLYIATRQSAPISLGGGIWYMYVLRSVKFRWTFRLEKSNNRQECTPQIISNNFEFFQQLVQIEK